MVLPVASANYPVTYHASFDAWREHTTRWVSHTARQGARLLLFPEYGSMELTSLLPAEVQQDLNRQLHELGQFYSDFCTVFADLAGQYGVAIVAPSFPVVQPSGNVFNRTNVFATKGLIGCQDKLMMTRFENEQWGVHASPPVFSLFEADWGRFGIQICYDVEFPLGSAVLCAAGADIILAPSCTETVRGSTRVHVGARARALENQCYTVVSPLVGDAPWSPAVDINYGYAAVYSSPDLGLPEEGIVAALPPQQPGWLHANLDLALLEAVRREGQVLNFRDNQTLLYGMQGKTLEIRRFRM
ncbi:MAG: nitrilase [Haliscomenobacteraceae bacterium CHB4]|nr:nitrilase [Haliscomenobacteraceae bacterium CHB4]